uniref:Uncharacterized protein n=1 Tax=Ditylum brightwellii TaxID=49249 RepID=A0A7S2EUE5_9STRA|mmetsp:Transcript_8260/g.12344  ORF Transcript_8260/g.12344 Transcript_8260/m.12344 type:complete len:100 (+) Transcript_8260:66-365(+)
MISKFTLDTSHEVILNFLARKACRRYACWGVSLSLHKQITIELKFYKSTGHQELTQCFCSKYSFNKKLKMEFHFVLLLFTLASFLSPLLFFSCLFLFAF